MTHPIPAAALNQHIGVLGKTGSGKTYAVRSAIENLLEAKARVCIVDPTGVWWGLRSSPTGKSAGFPVVIFGGAHADLPLAGDQGEAIAEIIGTTSTPTIIDTKLLRIGERTRFFTDFAEALMRHNRGPLHLVIDEAHRFAPKGAKMSPQSGAMLAAANELVSAGRSCGLRVILISQRPSKLHNDSLTQVETLIAMRVIAPHDRAAIEDWIKDNADRQKGQEIVSSLATLKTGHGWIWSPELGVLDRVQFPKIRTFDSGAAPDDDHRGHQVLAPIDRDAVLGRLKEAKATALANDPATLRLEIARLTRELAASKSEPRGASAADLAGAEAKGFNLGVSKTKDAARAQIEQLHVQMLRFVQDSFDFQVAPEVTHTVYIVHPQGPKAPATERALRETVKHAARMLKGNGAGEQLPIGERRVLQACIQFPDGLTREQLTVLTGYKKSTRNLYLQKLAARDLIADHGGAVIATDAGQRALPDAGPLPTGDALRDHWLTRLPAGERALLEILIKRYPKPVSREELSEITGYTKSTRNLYLQKLAAKELLGDALAGDAIATGNLFE